MPTYAELIVPQTPEEVEETLLSLAAAAGLPTTAWQAGAVPRSLISFFADVASDLWFGLARIANGVVLDYSSGAWLTILGRSQWREEMLSPTICAGEVVLTSIGGGPYTISAGQVTVATPSGVRFVNTTGGTLAVGGTLTLSVQAQKSGAAANVAIGAITVLVSSYPGVEVSNPEIGATGTWITSLGTDKESDAKFKARLIAKWGTLSTGSPKSAYKYWALSTPGVTRAKVDDENPDGPGTLRVYVDSALAVATLQATIDAKAPAGSGVTVVAATTQSVTVPGVVTVQRGYRTQAEIDVEAALVVLSGEIDIGGTVRQAEIVERVMAPAGVVDFVMSGAWAGAPNITLGQNKIPSLVSSLSWVEV